MTLRRTFVNYGRKKFYGIDTRWDPLLKGNDASRIWNGESVKIGVVLEDLHVTRQLVLAIIKLFTQVLYLWVRQKLHP
jgi:hypothetical protein